MKTQVEATQEFEMQLPETDAQAEYGGCRATSPRKDRMKSQRFDESVFWTLLYLQFKATMEHNNWVDCKRATHLLPILQGQAIQVLYNVFTDVRYENNAVAPDESKHGHHQLVATDGQVSARICSHH